jgi:hypothetical protein
VIRSIGLRIDRFVRRWRRWLLVESQPVPIRLLLGLALLGAFFLLLLDFGRRTRRLREHRFE